MENYRNEIFPSAVLSTKLHENDSLARELFVMCVMDITVGTVHIKYIYIEGTIKAFFLEIQSMIKTTKGAWCIVIYGPVEPD